MLSSRLSHEERPTLSPAHTRETPEGSRKLHMNMHFNLEYFVSGPISQVTDVQPSDISDKCKLR